MTSTTSLNAEQTAAVLSDHPTILITAAPGSGKTRTLVSRIVRLLGERVPAAEIVAITYTRAATQEIQARVAQACPIPNTALGYCGTLHGFLLRLVQSHGDRYTVLDKDQEEALLAECIQHLNYRGAKSAIGVDKTGVAELVAKRFRSQLRNNGLLTFDLILELGLEEAKKAVLPYTHLLVDEFQDSAVIDGQIYDALKIPNKLFVGDRHQAVYGFRGASLQPFENLRMRSDVEKLLLPYNYRSGNGICAAANRLIEGSHIVPVSEEPGEVTLKTCEDADEEKLAVALFIRSLNRAETCAVLLRTNHLAEEWAKALEGWGIPIAKRERVDRPQDWPLARLAVAFLADPENDWTAFRLLAETKGTEQAQKIKLMANASACSINSLSFQTLPTHNLTDFLQGLARLTVSEESIERINRIAEQLHVGASTAELVLALAAEEEESATIGNGVWVGTYHSAKGREFDAVCLPCLEEGILPTGAKSADHDEERRLLYVGITRARHRLFCSWAKLRKPPYGGGPAQPTTRSRFLQEAGL